MSEDGPRLESYFTDFVWESAVVDGGAAPRPDLGHDWTQSFDADPSHGFSACASFGELDTWTPDEGMMELVFGVVELAGYIATTPYLRGERATILALRAELPCADCLDIGVWTPAVTTLVGAKDQLASPAPTGVATMSWSICDVHWRAMRSTGADVELSAWSQPTASAEILDQLAQHYCVPLLSIDELTVLLDDLDEAAVTAGEEIS